MIAYRKGIVKYGNRKTPMMHSEPMTEIWGLLTEEQKKKVILMKMDMKIQWMEMKIKLRATTPT
jgi:hypothetical protein